MSKLDNITVRGFKSIASIEELELGPLTVLIGPNGSGKSNFLGVFSFLNALRQGRLQEYVAKAGGADKVLHFGSRVTERLHVHVAFKVAVKKAVDEYTIDLEPTGADELAPFSETVSFWDQGLSPGLQDGNCGGRTRGRDQQAGSRGNGIPCEAPSGELAPLSLPRYQYWLSAEKNSFSERQSSSSPRWCQPCSFPPPSP